MKSETLILQKTMHGLCLKDSRNNLLGWFTTEAEAKAWCEANGYNMRVQS